MATILLVDDEPDIRSLVRDVLGPQGYRILEAGNADEALRVAQEHDEPIDLLLTDVVMPGMHGHEQYMSGFERAWNLAARSWRSPSAPKASPRR